MSDVQSLSKHMILCCEKVAIWLGLGNNKTWLRKGENAGLGLGKVLHTVGYVWKRWLATRSLSVRRLRKGQVVALHNTPTETSNTTFSIFVLHRIEKLL